MSEILDLSGRVIACANPETGELIKVGNNTDYCGVKVTSSVLENDEGFWNMRTRVATIRLQVSLAKALMSKGLLKDGKELPIQGKIIIRESFEPFYAGQEPKMNPTTMNIVCFANRPVYRQSIFTSNMDERDMFIKDYWFSTVVEKANIPNVKETIPYEQFMEAHFPEPEPCYDELTI